MQAVIFLDVDGVLNSEFFLLKLDAEHRALGHHESCECFRLERKIDREAVARLNRLVAETGAKIVISSSWRLLMDPPELHRVLAEHGLVAEVIGETPDLPAERRAEAAFEERVAYGSIARIERGHEIDAWLTRNPGVDRWVILDDAADMAMHRVRLVQTDSEDGLLDEHVTLAKCMLAWDGMDERELAASMEQALAGAAVRPPSGSSWGLHCNLFRDGCPETLTLGYTTAATAEDDYLKLAPALEIAAVGLGWREFHGTLWCPTHVAAKNLVCACCGQRCPACTCLGGPHREAIEGITVGAEGAG